MSAFRIDIVGDNALVQQVLATLRATQGIKLHIKELGIDEGDEMEDDGEPYQHQVPFMPTMTVSPTLATVIGPQPLPKTEVVRRLWEYIKANKLQDSHNKRLINCDGKLKAVFGKAQVSMFELAGLVGKHLS